MSKGNTKMNDIKSNGEDRKSFVDRMKNDKKYSAKVQLIGYGLLIVLLVIYLNFSNTGNNISNGNAIFGNNNVNTEVENIDEDNSSLLEQVSNNYSYDVVIDVKKNNEENEEEEKIIRYSGKSYDNKQEINKVEANVNTLYYKVDNRYYSKNNEMVSFVKEDIVYDVIDGEYIEIADILKLMDKASLDHVTDYSSGKKEYVYHLKVKDVVVSYQKEDVIEIEVEEENGVLKIAIDYSTLFKAMDDNIIECKLKATITQIGEVEEFEVIVADGSENTSVE